MFRFDCVGSLLRPEPLRAAWADHQAGRIDAAALTAVMDETTTKAIATQEQHDYPVLVDGEYRRRVFTETFQVVRGFEQWADRYAQVARDVETSESESAGRWQAPSSAVLVPATAPLELAENGPLTEYRFAQALTSRPVKMTLIGPDRIFQTYDRDASRSVYPDPQNFLNDVVRVEREIISGLVAAGCTYIQLDAPGFTAYVDEPSLARFRARGIDPQEMMRMTIEAENAVVRDFPSVTFGLHICRGNQNGHWHREGAYDTIAEQLFNSLEHDRLLLEYDTERAGTFDALRFVPKDKVAVLGLVTTKNPALETKDELKRRIEDAGRYVDIDHMAISPQCGFASGMDAAVMSEDDQWRKLDRCLEVAREVWPAG